MADLFLTIAVRCVNNTYEARARRSVNTATSGLAGRKATATSGEEDAINRLLSYAVPPHELDQVKQIHRGATPAGPHFYEIVARVKAQPLASRGD